MSKFFIYFVFVIIASCKNELGFKTTERSINNPNDVPNLLFWFDASDILGNGSSVADGSSINTNWIDKSGTNQINLLTGASPTLVHDGLNGKASSTLQEQEPSQGTS